METNLFSTSRKAISKVNFAFLLLVFMLLTACGGSKNTDTEDFRKLKKLVSSREFVIEHQWANPSWGGSNINLTGNANFIRFKGDSVNIFLPYFGVSHSGGGYGSEGGIKYKDPVKNLKVTASSDEQELILQFEGEQGIENLQFYVTLFPNGNASTSVNSSQRAPISYRGDIKPLPEEQEE